MNLFKKTRDRLMQTVGIDRVPTDADLAASYHKLQVLEKMIQNLRGSARSYAKAMLTVGDASRKIAEDIDSFYKKSQPRQKSVGLFVNAQSDQESNILFMFKEQFGFDVEREFDLWTESTHKLKEKLLFASDKIENGEVSDAHQLKAPLLAEVAKAVDNRYPRFDRIFIRMMEFQMEFFKDGLEVTEKFSPVVTSFRKKNLLAAADLTTAPSNAAPPTIPTSSTPPSAKTPSTTSQSSPNNNEMKSPVKKVEPKPAPTPSPTPSPSPSPTSAPQSQSKPSNESSKPPTVDLFGGLTTNASANTASQTTAKPKPSQVNLFDIDFNDSAPSPSPSVVSSHNNDMFGGLFDATPSPAPSSNQQNNGGFDILGLDSMNFDNNSKTTTPLPKKSANNDFDPSFFSSPSSSNTNTNTKSKLPSSSSSSSHLDDIDDDMSSPPSNGGNGVGSVSGGDMFDNMLAGFSSSTSSSAPTSSSFDSFDPLSSSSVRTSNSAKPKREDIPVQRVIAPQLPEAEEKAAIDNIKHDMQYKVETWKTSHGTDRPIQSLLATLHTILWEGHVWKKVDSTQLLDYNSVKKAYRRALLTVHPDKVSTGTPEMKATADMVFHILNVAFNQYEVSLGMRSV